MREWDASRLQGMHTLVWGRFSAQRSTHQKDPRSSSRHEGKEVGRWGHVCRNGAARMYGG